MEITSLLFYTCSSCSTAKSPTDCSYAHCNSTRIRTIQSLLVEVPFFRHHKSQCNQGRHLILHYLLPSPRIQTPHLPPASLAVVTCNPPPPAGRRWSNAPPLPNDCAHVVDIIIATDKTHAPIHFPRQPGADFLVPHCWRMGTCVIDIDTVQPFDEDDFPLSETGLAGAAIVRVCVVAGPGHRGGDFAGPKKMVVVSMYGMHASRQSLAETAGARNSSSSSLLGVNSKTPPMPLQGGGTAVARYIRSQSFFRSVVNFDVLSSSLLSSTASDNSSNRTSSALAPFPNLWPPSPNTSHTCFS